MLMKNVGCKLTTNIRSGNHVIWRTVENQSIKDPISKKKDKYFTAYL